MNDLTTQNRRDRSIFCNICRRETHHECKYTFSPEISGPAFEPLEGSVWRMWVCKGCDEALLEEGWSIGAADEDGELYTTLEETVYEWRFIPERRVYFVDGKQFVRLPKLDFIHLSK